MVRQMKFDLFMCEKYLSLVRPVLEANGVVLRIYSKIRVKRPCLEASQVKNGYCLWDEVADNSIMNRDKGGRGDHNRVVMVLCGDCLIRGRRDNIESQPTGTKSRVTLCEYRSKQDRAVRSEVEAVGRLGAAAVDIGCRDAKAVTVDERLGGPGRRIGWLIAGSAGCGRKDRDCSNQRGEPILSRYESRLGEWLACESGPCRGVTL